MALNPDIQIKSRKLFQYITKKKKDVGSIYIYAIMSGLVQLSIPLGIQAIVSFVLGATMVTSLYLLIAFVVLGTFLAGFFRIRVMQIIEKIQQKIFVEYALAFAEKLPRINLTANKKYYLPELVNRFFDAPNLQKGISKILLEIPTALIQIVFGILLLSFYHPWFLLFGAMVVAIVILIFRFSMNSGIKSSVDESDRKYEVASWLEDIAGSVKTFKLNSRANTHLTGTDERVVNYLEARTSHFKVLLFQYWVIVGFKVVITLLMLGIGVYLLINQELNIGPFVAAEIVVLTILMAVEKLIKSLESYYDVITSLQKLEKVTGLEEELSAEIEMPPSDAGINIIFKDVMFRFSDQKPILTNLNFQIPANGITVIRGPLGVGKSLLLNMMAGFYEPVNGNILFDKVPLKNLDKSSFREVTGVYLEDMTVIKGSLLDNIILGRDHLGAQEVLELAEKWGMNDFSGRFTEGFLTILSETDTELSFSARKKILLLRAMLGHKRLLLLEDPIDGMNEEFAQNMISYLNNLKQKSTIVIVSENEALLRIADNVLILKDGTVISEHKD